MAEQNVAVALTGEQQQELLKLLRRVRVTASNRSYVKGQSMPLGWTNFRRGDSIARRVTRSETRGALQLYVNKLIKDTYGEDYCWSSLMINRNTDSEVHIDRYNKNMNVGIVVGMNMGEGEGELRGVEGKFRTAARSNVVVAGGNPSSVLLAAPNHMVMFDPLMPHYNTPYNKKTAVRYSIIAFTHRSIVRANQYALKELEALGYRPFPTPMPNTIELQLLNGRVININVQPTTTNDEDSDIEDVQEYESDDEAVQERSVKVKGFLARLSDKLKCVCCSA
jgi:hypothetical protein